MKYDLSRTPSRGAAHTLESFSDAMFELLRKKPFEKITINEVCTLAGFPRATFYNYFDDKYDLVNYCWIVVFNLISLDSVTPTADGAELYQYFDHIYDFLNQNARHTKDVFAHNPPEGYLHQSLISFVHKTVRELCLASEKTSHYQIPLEVLAANYTSTFFIIFDWWFFRQNSLSKEEGHALLDRLLYGKYL